MTHYSKRAVKRAGNTIVNPSASPCDRAAAEEVINYWRNIHRLPLQRILQDLDRLIGASADCPVAGRIKKFDTIVDKMTRRKGIENLAAMNDIAGCRIVVPNLATQATLCDRLSKMEECDAAWSQRHDYIDKPKESGYRGRHMLFRYFDSVHGYALAVELQVRTEYQHAWATAVEMYDAATGDRLKFGEGEPSPTRFFQKVSVLMRQAEECGSIDHSSIRSFDDDLNSLQSTLSTLKVLEAASQSVSILGNEPALNPENYCLVDFDPAEQTIVLTELSPQDALEAYFNAEGDPERKGHNFVLLRGARIERLKRLYPNYFGNISQSVNLFNGLIYKNLQAFA